MGIPRKYRALYLQMMALWLVLAGELTVRQVLTGLLSCWLALQLYRWILKNSGAEPVKGLPAAVILHYCLIVAAEIFRSAVGHLFRIAKGRSDTSVCRLRLAVTDELPVTLIANAITLTPGTVTLEADRHQITVLCYGAFDKQCPLDLVLMAERVQKPFLTSSATEGRAEHA